MDVEGGEGEEAPLWGPDDPEIYDDCEEVEGPEAGEGGAAEFQQEDDMEAEAGAAAAAAPEEQTYLPGDALPSDMELTFDPTAYMTHQEWTSEWPCLSCDIIPDSLGASRQTFPMTAYVLGGTQAGEEDGDELLVMKLTQIRRSAAPALDEDDEDDDDDTEPPSFHSYGIKHPGAVNRVKMCPHPGNLAASWSASGRVSIWDLTPAIEAVDGGHRARHAVHRPEFTFKGHSDEGYALDWSPLVPYRMASGDNASFTHVWNRKEDGGWVVDPKPCAGHSASVEDIAWSPSEKTVFASASADETIRIWDLRAGNRCALTVHAHDSDVNTISWNRCEQHLMASGADDGTFRVWDLRTFGAAAKGNSVEPVASFHWHRAAVTSVEWHPTDASVLCVAGEDDQVSIWDMAVEADPEASRSASASLQREVPPQLLFIHQGMSNVREAHWHRQLPGVIVATAESGFNFFKTISVTQ
eukprot:m.447501 g.447501  ORF g.447501 m.447501 type:complete len:469 (+) comp19523_c0_seq1:25-1431(+)